MLHPIFKNKLVGTICKKYFSTYPELSAIIRSNGQSGSRQSRNLRKDGFIPGVVYGQDDDNNSVKTLIGVNQKALATELREKGTTFENTLYELVVESEFGPMKVLVTPRQTQFNPVTDLPVSVNFLKYRPGNRVRIPVEFVNADQSQDLKRGSFMIRINQFVECICDKDIPKSIIVDLSNAAKGDVYHLRSIELPPNVRPSKFVPADYVLCVIKSARK